MRVGYQPPSDSDCLSTIEKMCADENGPLKVLRLINNLLDDPISEIVTLSLANYGYPHNGTWDSGRLGQLYNNRFDVLAAPLSYNSIRGEYFEYSLDVGYENPHFMLPVPAIDETATAFRLFFVFEPSLSLVSFTTLILLLLTIKLWCIFNETYITMEHEGPSGKAISIWSLFEFYMIQNSVSAPKRPISLGLLVLVLSLLTFFTLCLYQSYLLTLLISPQFNEPSVSSVDQLITKVQRGEMNIILDAANNSYHNYIMTSPQVNIRGLNRALNDPSIPANLYFNNDANQVRDLLLTGKYVGLTDRNIAFSRVNRFCDLTILRAEGFANPTTHFLLQQGDYKRMKDLNRAIGTSRSRIRQINDEKERRYEEQRRFCDSQISFDGNLGKPLKVVALAGGLVLFVAGLALSIFTFGLEMIRAKTNVKRQVQIKRQSLEMCQMITANHDTPFYY